MNIMNYLTRKHMFGNRRRTIMTICGVIVSVAMITAVAIGAQSFMGLMQKMEMQSDGAWHSGVKNVTYEQALELGKDENITNIFFSKPGNYATMENFESKNEEKPYVYVHPLSEKGFDGLAVHLLSGRMPETPEEIVVGEHLLKNGGVELQIGDTLTLNLGERYLLEDGQEWILDRDFSYQHEDPAIDRQEEQFRVLETKTYTVVGIIERPLGEGWFDPGYSCYSFFDPEDDDENINAYFFCEKVTKNFMKEAEAKAEKAGINKEKVFYNTGVLRYYGVSSNNGFAYTIEIMEIVLIVIIMVGSISLIYNSFAISISERSKQFGMLSSVGATRKQKRNAVFYEGAVIGGIAIPIGLLSGVLGMGITLSVVRSILQKMTPREMPLTLEIALKPFLLAIAVSILTIFLSAWIPARRAAKISAIDAIRQTQDIRVRGKKLHTGFWVRKIFGLPGELALKNLKRNRRRYAALVFSLFISLVLFITVGTYVTMISDAYTAVTDDGDGDIIVYFPNSGNKNVYDKLISLDGIKESAFVTHLTQFMPISEEFSFKLSEDYKNCCKKQMKSWGMEKGEIAEEISKLESQMEAFFTILPDEDFLRYAENVKLTAGKETLNQAIMINFVRTRADGYQTDCKIFDDYDKGELKVWDIERDRSGVETDRKELRVPILGDTTEAPFGVYYFDAEAHGVRVIISQTLFRSFEENLSASAKSQMEDEAFFDVTDDWNSDNDAEAENILESGAKDYNYYNRMESIKANERFLLIISIFAYGFIVLISLICLANLCNTISTSFALRRREFAMLKSMGMEPKAFSKMLRYECLFYGIKALAFGVPVSIGIGYWMHSMMEEGIYSSPFRLPIHIYAIGIGAVLAVVFTAMGYGAGKVRKDTIVEGLKSEAE